MSDCQERELQVSCLVDGELSSQDTLETIDHLLGCSSCRALYEQSRDLDRALVPLRSAKRTAKPRLARAPVTRRSSAPRVLWPVAAAAVLLLSLGLWGWRVEVPTPAAGLDRVIAVSPTGQMDDARFVDLTLELLRADARYHLEMLDVLYQAHGNDYLEEGPWMNAFARADQTSFSELPGEDASPQLY